MTRDQLKTELFRIRTRDDFERLVLEVFRYQYQGNGVYQAWCNALRKTPDRVFASEDVPCLPISFFKTHRVITGDQSPEFHFSSSGTSGDQTSRHYVSDPELYTRSFLEGFRRIYGKPSDWTILGLLPSYLERSGSGLIYMCKGLMDRAREGSNFFLHNHAELQKVLLKAEARDEQVLLIGVSFALLDFAATQPPVWKNLYVVETGGMKGRRREMIRDELHQEIRQHWPVQHLHSEYGMTELFSQAWKTDEGGFRCPPWMSIRIVATDDPLSSARPGSTGGINVIDLANLDSVSFIATSDLGRLNGDGTLEIMGRFDHSDVRGCSLMV